MNLPKAKIEERAINTLRDIIDQHPTMLQDFKNMDNEMSWDGYIWIYNSETEQSKETYDDKVPVQIKGHIDQKRKYLDNARITYPVNLADLKVYFKGTGVLYFIVFMSQDGKKREVFYASLFPSKIKTYLEDAEKRGNTKTINIPFTKLNKTVEIFYIIVKQFSIECRKQGSGVGPVVQSILTEKDMDKVETITVVAVGAQDEHDFFEKLSTGDVCIYGKAEGDSIAVPLKWDDDPQKVFKKEADRAVEIEHTISYIG